MNPRTVEEIKFLQSEGFFPGADSVFILTLAPYNYKNYWMTENGKRGEAYYKLKDEVADKLIKKVEETLIPNFSKHIVVKDAATPMTFERNYLSR